jgi:hypothetical protein
MGALAIPDRDPDEAIEYTSRALPSDARASSGSFALRSFMAL